MLSRIEMYLRQRHLMLGGVLALPLVLVFCLYCSSLDLQPLYVYNPLSSHFPLATNLIQADQTLSIPGFYNDVDHFIQTVLSKRYRDYRLEIQTFHVIFAANKSKIRPESGRVELWVGHEEGYDGPSFNWLQNIQVDFKTQEMTYKPDLSYILLYEHNHSILYPVSFYSPDMIQPKREIMREAETLGGKVFRQQYCSQDCRVFVGVHDYDDAPPVRYEIPNDELPDDIEEKWGRAQGLVCYRDQKGHFFTVWFLPKGKTWVIDSTKSR